MPEATLLYSVAAAVVAGLVAWVGYTLATKKEPWSRPRPQFAPAADVPIEPPAPAEEQPVVEEKRE